MLYFVDGLPNAIRLSVVYNIVDSKTPRLASDHRNVGLDEPSLHP